MKRRLAEWSARLDALSLRERGLVFAAALMVLFLVWDQLLLSPLDQRQLRTSQELEGLRAQAEQIRNQVQSLSSGGRGGRLAALRDEQRRLEEAHRRLDARLQEATTGLIAPAAMARVLEEVLSRQSGLTLLRVENLAPRPLFGDSESPASLAAIYRHGLVIEFEGTYADTLRYLRALEALPHTFFWEAVEFDVERYPRARVRLTVFTLGLEEGWIGV